MKVFEKFTASWQEVLATIKRLKAEGYGDVDWQRTKHGFKVVGYLR